MNNSKDELNELYDSLIERLLGGISAGESTEWDIETRNVSNGMREALYSQYTRYSGRCDTRFMDYCNIIKSMLAVYDFGNLDTEGSLSWRGIKEDDAEYAEYIERLAKDKAAILDGIRNILNHVKTRGYDITPYLDVDGCSDIFGNGDSKDKVSIECTLSATTVFTTLVYFRRAVKRKAMFTRDELTTNGVDLVDAAAKTITDIMIKFVKYVENNGYTGWGFTFDSKAITLNDTYAVVDAVGRFEDAFEKDKEDKKDDEFLAKITKYADEAGYDALIKRCTGSTYKVAYNIYEQTRDVYGQSIFYSAGATKKRDEMIYSYVPTTYEQIGSSSRSSALFNPLYVAMITMYGYNDKELVIRRLMDDYSLVNSLYEEYEFDEDEEDNKDDDKEKAESNDEEEKKDIPISRYAYDLPWYRVTVEGDDETLARQKTAEKFKTDVLKLLEPHQTVSHDYSDNERWANYYKIARVIQKYLEEVRPERLMEITEYRDYLNATKDAIDQVQVAYRKFGNSQRLGIVDTDYIMFSALDINTDPVNISKLNKANIAVNNLRPLLLSSKIMIVNALTKYPQSDMEELYGTIKKSIHRKSSKGVSRKTADRGVEWLWNEDNVDMNSTARHCEAITYDYFDYYDRYELGLKAMNGLKKSVSRKITKKLNEDGSLPDVVDEVLADDRLHDFKRIVLNVTRRNMDLIKDSYRKRLESKDVEILKCKRDAQKDLDKAYEEKQRELAKKDEEIEELKKSFDLERHAMLHSTTIGDTLRSWIREETESYLREMLSMVILNNINGLHSRRVINIKSLIGSKGKMLDADFREVGKVAERIEDEYRADSAAAESKYTPKFVRALEMQELFEAAFNGILKMQDVDDLSSQSNKDIKTRNADIREVFRDSETNLRVNNFYENIDRIMRALPAMNKKAFDDDGEDK